MPWAVRAVQLPDGDQPVDMWVDDGGCLVSDPIPARICCQAAMWCLVWSMLMLIQPWAGTLRHRSR